MRTKFYSPIKCILLLALVLCIKNVQAQYCTPYYYFPCTYYSTYIRSFSTTGGTTNISNINSNCASGFGNAYTYYSSQTHTGVQGGTVGFTIVNNPFYSLYYRIYVDFNKDNDFVDAGEQVYFSSVGTSSTGTTSSFTIPSGATLGTTRMRVIAEYFPGFNSCGPTNYSYLYYGECEDYVFVINSTCNITYSAQPSSTSICAGGNASFSGTASNATSYQWQVNTGSGFSNISNGGVYSNATTASLTITGATASMNGYQYRLVSTNSNCSLNSNAATLTVNTSPAISANPASTIICPGANGSFTVAASGAGLTYQWQVNTGSGFTNISNGGVYSGATAATLNITAAPVSMDGYQYQVVVSGTCSPSTTSTAATLTVSSTVSATGNPSNSTICAGSNTSFTGVFSGTGLSYQWQVNNGSGFTNISNGGVYSGATTPTLTITNATASLNGSQYRLVGSRCSNSSNTNAATLTVNAAAVVTASPSATTACAGSPASFSVTATGTSLSYQWQESAGGAPWANLSNNATYNGVTTATLNISATTAGMNGYDYRCLVTSSICGGTTSSGMAKLTVGPMTVTAQPVDKIICAGSATTFSVSVIGTGLTYQWQESTNGGSTFSSLSNTGVYSGVTSNTLTISSGSVGMDNYRYRCVITSACSSPTNSGTAKLTVNSLPAITAHPVNTTSCDGVAITTTVPFSVTATGTGITYQWQVDNGSGFSNIPLTGAGYGNSNSNTLLVFNPTPAMSGYTYRCIVSGTCTPPATSNAATLTVNTRPSVTSQPVNSQICNGSNASFTLSAVATGISYQWQAWNGTAYVNISNSATYSGTTTNSLTVTAPTVAQNGTNSYRCIVSSTVCTPTATSAAVYHFVSTAPTILTHPVDQAACNGGTAAFYATGTAVTPAGNPTYQWQVSTDNGNNWSNLSNSAPYSNVTKDRMNITGATLTMDGYLYRCVLSTACSPSATTNSARLYISFPPTIGGQPTDRTVCPGTPATFNVGANGTNLRYQWQVNTGSGFANIPVSSTQYAGVNGANLVVTSPTSSMHNYQYRVVVSGDCTPSVTSVLATLKVHRPVNIISQTITDTACESSEKEIGLQASGNALLYQWQVQTGPNTYQNLFNAPPYSGVNRDTLRITNVPANLNGRIYRCYITEKILCNLDYYSADITLGVTPAPVSSPAELTVPFYGTAVFSVPNAGTSFQWQENVAGTGFADITDTVRFQGINTNTLTINTLGMDMNGNQYRCIVDGVCVSPVASKPSVLKVDASVSVRRVANSDISMRVYPNPLEGTQLNISFSKAPAGKTAVRVLDKLGKLVYEGSITLNNNAATVELKALPAGTYLLQVYNANANFKEAVQFTKQ